MNIRTLLTIGIGVLLLLAVGCSNDQSSEKPDQNEQAQDAPVKREKDETVAVVNGVEIKQKDLDIRLKQVGDTSQGNGVDFDREINSEQYKQLEEQALNQLIDAELLIQAADKANITVPEEEITQSITDIKSNLGDNEKFQSALDKYEMTEEDLQVQLENEMKMNQFLTQETELPDISDEEAKAAYKKYAATQEDALPFEEIKDSIKQQLAQRKQNEQITDLVKKLRDEAKIEKKI